MSKEVVLDIPKPLIIQDKPPVKEGTARNPLDCEDGYCLFSTKNTFTPQGRSYTVVQQDTDAKVMVIDKDVKGHIAAFWDSDSTLDAFLEDAEAYFSCFDQQLPCTTTGVVTLYQEYEEPLTGEFTRPLVVESFVHGEESYLDDEHPYSYLRLDTDAGSLMYEHDGAIGVIFDMKNEMRNNTLAAVLDLVHATRSDIPEYLVYKAIK